MAHQFGGGGSLSACSVKGTAAVDDEGKFQWVEGGEGGKYLLIEGFLGIR